MSNVALVWPEHQILIFGASQPFPGVSGGGGLIVDTQEFFETGEWIKPEDAQEIEIHLWSAGSGGGGGAWGEGTQTGGGGGAAGGVYQTAKISASAAAATELVTVSLGGAGGLGATVSNTSGENGQPGGNTSFGILLEAWNFHINDNGSGDLPYGFGGSPTQAGSSGNQGPPGADYPFNWMDGGSGGGSWSSDASTPDGSIYGCGNGGGGGGVYNSVPGVGTYGGLGSSLYSSLYMWPNNQNAAVNPERAIGGGVGLSGENARDTGLRPFPVNSGHGGAGGGSSIGPGPGGNGGNGGFPGGAGGGGGGGLGVAGGNGGNGSNGYARIITYCWKT